MSNPPSYTRLRQVQDSPKLLVADLLLSGQVEIWYELFWVRDAIDPCAYVFMLYLARIDSLPPPRSVFVHFGPVVHHVQLDSTGKAEWSLPETVVLDPKHKRFLRPIRLTLLQSN